MFPPQHSMLAFVLFILSAGAVLAAPGGSVRYQETTSPDGTLIAFVSSEDGDSEIFVERANGTDRRKLTNNDASDNNPNWSPDGKRIAFASDRGGQPQVYVMDQDGASVSQLSRDEAGCVTPKFGPQGQIAWLARRGRAFKRELFDLVIQTEGATQTLRLNTSIWDFVWHPDGQRIAYATDGEFKLYDIRAETTVVVRFADIDPRLSSHGAFDCRWSNQDQAFVCRLRFLGGIREGSTVFGDNKEFVIVPGGNSRLLDGLDDE